MVKGVRNSNSTPLVASVASVAWAGGKGDVVASFHASCTKRGVGPSLFYSTHYNWVLGVNNYEEGWPRLYGGPPLTQAQYAASAGAQLEELQSALFDEPAGGLTDAALAALAEGAGGAAAAVAVPESLPGHVPPQVGGVGQPHHR